MKRLVCLVASGLLAAVSLPVLASQEEAREWLDRMTEALASSNYDGLFTHTTRHHAETMRIVHRVENGHSVERLVSLDGSGREIVRTREQVHCYLPDRRVVLVEPRTDLGALFTALPASGPETDSMYQMSVSEGRRVLGQPVRIVDVVPRDRFRYGYRLWIAEETAMPLRSVVIDGRGRPVEQTQFTKLEVLEHIPAKETEASVDATGFQWIRGSVAGGLRLALPEGLRSAKFPHGFHLVGVRQQAIPGSPMPVQHLIFSDGFVAVSVFIEHGHGRGPTPPGGLRVGSANAYTASAEGRVVTAVGEVPEATVRDIAAYLVKTQQSAPAATGK
jgi:sigma-E factor negative regulatory protein RseB